MSTENRPGATNGVYGRAVDGYTAKICEHLGYDGVLVDLGEVVTVLAGRAAAASAVSWTDIVRHVDYVAGAIGLPVIVAVPDAPECQRAATELPTSIQRVTSGEWTTGTSVLGDDSGTFAERLERLRSNTTDKHLVVDGPALAEVLAIFADDLREFVAESAPNDAPRDEGRFELLTTVLGLPEIYEMEAKYADEPRS